MTFKKYDLLFSILVSVIAFGVYIATLAPTVWFIDSGELATVCVTLSIAHPTGYPLFTIVGHLFSLLPFSNSEIYKMNVMSAFFCTLGIFVFYYLLSFMFANPATINAVQKNQPAAKKGDRTNIISKFKMPPFIIVTGIICFACLELAFSNTYWDTANSVEVYPIQVFFISLLMLVFLKAITGTKAADAGGTSFVSENKYYLLFAFLLGLSFSNHMTTILLAPACMTLFFYTNLPDRKKTLRLLGYMTPCFLASLSLYLYLPIRANMNPILIWGNPYNWERFIWHVTAKQFTVWIFSAPGSAQIFILLVGILVILSVIGLVKQKTLAPYYHFVFFIVVALIGYFVISASNEIVVKQFHKFTDSLWTQFGPGFVLLSVLGIYRLSSFNLKIFYFTLLTFFGCLFYSINYDINDIYSYFLLSYMTLAVWLGFGAYFIYEKISVYVKNSTQQIAFAVILCLVTITPMKTNWENNDESKNYYVEEFTMNVFRNIEPNGIIISSQWDFWVAASWYYKYVKHMRPDIVVIDKELLRRSWYFTFMERNYPEIYNNSRAEIEKFLPELYKFEHGIPYDTKTIMQYYSDMMTSFVEKNPGRKIYDTWEIEQNKNEPFATNYLRVPDGMLFRLIKREQFVNNEAPDYNIYDFKFTPTTIKDYYHQTLMTSYASMLTNSASYLISVNRKDDARKYLDLALYAIPNYPQALELKKRNNL